MATSPATPSMRKYNSVLDIATGSNSVAVEHKGEDLYELIKTQHEHGYEPKNHPDFLIRFFYNWGYMVGKYPKVTMLMCTIVAVIFASGIPMVETEVDFIELFLDHNSADYKNYQYIVDTFGGVQGSLTTSSYMFVKGKGDLLTPEGMQALIQLSDDWSTGLGKKWEDVAEKYDFNGQYASPSGISRLYNSTNIPTEKEQILADLNAKPIDTWNGEELSSPSLYQYTKDADGNYQTANIAMIGVTYKVGIEAGDKEAEDYEKALFDIKDDFNSDLIEDVYFSNNYQGLKDAEGAQRELTNGIVIAAILICLYCLTTMRIGRVHGRSEMMIGCLISVGYATLSAYGLMGFIGTTWSGMNFLAIILLMGISFDDCFVLTWDYHQQYLWGMHLMELEENKGKSINEIFPVEERIGNTMAAGGYSVFITSFTDLIIFSIAAGMSAQPMIQGFALFCGFGVFLDFLFQTTLFLALLHFSAKRQEAGRMDCCCCFPPPEDVNARDCGKEPLNPFVNNSIYDKFFGQYLPNIILSRVGMFAVISCWLLLLVTGIVGMTKVETTLNTADFSEEGTDGYEIGKITSDPNEPNSYDPNTIVFKSNDFIKDKDNINAVLDALQGDTEHFAYTSSIWQSYSYWVFTNNRIFPTTHTAFSTDMNIYVNTEDGFAYAMDVSFEDAANTDVIAIRGMTYMAGQNKYEVILDNYDEMKKVVESRNGDGFEGFRFGTIGALYEVVEDSLPNLLLSLYVGVPVITVIVLANLRHLQASFYVFIMIVSIDIELIGISALLGTTFDFMFSVAVLLALGVTVDFNIHVAHRSLELLEDDTIENAYERNVDHTRKVYMSVGSSVFHGTFSTLLVCFVPMVVSSVKAYRSFFGMLCLIMIFGMFHGLVILPVLMTIFPITHEHTQKAVTIRRQSQLGDLTAFQTSDAMKEANAGSESEEDNDKRSPRTTDVEMN